MQVIPGISSATSARSIRCLKVEQKSKAVKMGVKCAGKSYPLSIYEQNLRLNFITIHLIIIGTIYIQIVHMFNKRIHQVHISILKNILPILIYLPIH